MKAKVLNQARWMIALTALVLAVEIALIVAGDARTVQRVGGVLNVIMIPAVWLLNPLGSLRIAYGTRALGIWIVAITFFWAPMAHFSAVTMSDPWPILLIEGLVVAWLTTIAAYGIYVALTGRFGKYTSRSPSLHARKRAFPTP